MHPNPSPPTPPLQPLSSAQSEMMELPVIVLASCDQDLQSALWSLSEDSNTLPGNYSLEPSVSVQWWSLTAPTNTFTASPFIRFLIYDLLWVVVGNKCDWTAAHRHTLKHIYHNMATVIRIVNNGVIRRNVFFCVKCVVMRQSRSALVSFCLFCQHTHS